MDIIHNYTKIAAMVGSSSRRDTVMIMFIHIQQKGKEGGDTYREVVVMHTVSHPYQKTLAWLYSRGISHCQIIASYLPMGPKRHIF